MDAQAARDFAQAFSFRREARALGQALALRGLGFWPILTRSRQGRNSAQSSEAAPSECLANLADRMSVSLVAALPR